MLNSTAYAQDSTNCSEAKSIAAVAVTKAEEAQKDTRAALKEAEDAKAALVDASDQRDAYRLERDNVRAMHANLAGQITIFDLANKELKQKNAALVVRESATKAELAQVKRTRWYWIGGAAVVGIVAGGYIGLKVLK